MSSNGQRLRLLRESLGLTIRDVEVASMKIVARTGVNEYGISVSRLSDIETKGVLPNIYKLYSMSAIYKVPYKELLGMFGIDEEHWLEDTRSAAAARTHRFPSLLKETVKLPVKLDPAFDPRKTTNIGRMIEKWGVVPLSFLEGMADGTFTYGYIGSEDYTMYPLLLPGSFVQVDEGRAKVQEGHWRSEYERPVYLVESREGYTVSWCSIKGAAIILQPHPLSPVSVRMYRHPQEAEVIGQVVGVAMRLDQEVRNPQLNS